MSPMVVLAKGRLGGQAGVELRPQQFQRVESDRASVAE